MTDSNGFPNAVVIERSFDAPVESGLADVDRPGTLQGVVRARRRHHSGRQDGRARRRHPSGVHGGADPGRPDADVVRRRVPRGHREQATRLHRVDVRRARQRLITRGHGHARGASDHDRGPCRTRRRRWPDQDGDDPCSASPATPPVRPDGRWHSTSSPPTSQHTTHSPAAVCRRCRGPGRPPISFDEAGVVRRSVAEIDGSRRSRIVRLRAARRRLGRRLSCRRLLDPDPSAVGLDESAGDGEAEAGAAGGAGSAGVGAGEAARRRARANSAGNPGPSSIDAQRRCRSAGDDDVDGGVLRGRGGWRCR